MSNPIHPKLEIPLLAADGLVQLTRELARIAAAEVAPARRKIGATLRPGRGTPLWNALAASARGELKAYGEQSRLGRILGVPPQRVHDYLKAGTAMPDAERTLQLLVWLAQKRALPGEPG